MYPYFKRLFDISCSTLAILVLSPLLVPVMILLKLTGEGEVFYSQERIGYKNRSFNIWKFATMLKNSSKMEGGLITVKKDPRLTPLGGFLRSSKINELPQLFNILFGQMSIIGPRPLMKQSFDVYPDDIQKLVYNVRPGLSGIGSLVFRDEEALITKVKESGGDTWAYYADVIYPYKGQLEKWYQQNQSLKVDFTILFLTAWAVLVPDNQLVFKIFKSLPQRERDLI
jgi:lipopolysaccharide/colanic/teichoic acid biosynthesis glycosyltransferase